MAICAATLVGGCAAIGRAELGSRSVGSPVAIVAPDLSGTPVDIFAAQGRVRIVHFWASWCEPCARALPELYGLTQELGSVGLEVYAVSIDRDRQALEAFLARRSLKLRVLIDDEAAQMSRLDVHTMPVSLIVDRHGVIRYVDQGWDARSVGRERSQVEVLLAED